MKLLKWLEVAGRVLLAGVLIVVNVIMNVIGLIMLGYNDLKSPSVSGFFRFLAKLGDGFMKMQIVRIDFGEVQ